MRRVRLVSLPSAFIAGALCATALAAIPAIADIVPGDQHPTLFDGSSPSLTVQPAVFQLGSSITPSSGGCDGKTFNWVTMQLAWNAQDTGSGAASYDIAMNDPEVGDLELAGHTTATTRTWGVDNWDNGCEGGGLDDASFLWVIARDHRGFTATSPAISSDLDVWDENGVMASLSYPDGEWGSLAVARTGTWSTSSCACHNHGKTTYTTARNASLTYTVNIDQPGRTLALVAPTGSTRGVMNISVDGGPTAAVNTYTSGPNVNRVVVWQRTLNAGQHTVRIANAATAGHPRIDVDTLMLGPAWGAYEVARYYHDRPCC